jgi:ATP-dependent 26S proteasome regulatory subunit
VFARLPRHCVRAAKACASAQLIPAYIVVPVYVGFSGAELSNMVNEAALVAAKQHAAHIDTAGLEFAQVPQQSLSAARSLMHAQHAAECWRLSPLACGPSDPL